MGSPFYINKVKGNSKYLTIAHNTTKIVPNSELLSSPSIFGITVFGKKGCFHGRPIFLGSFGTVSSPLRHH